MKHIKHINIPVFIPHLGCPHSCVFCDQRTISGTARFNESEVVTIIEDAIASSPGAEREIAYFGGSFTGIDRTLMTRLLDLAQSYVQRGDAIGIRMSTRPDYIDKEIIYVLKNYTVSQVELGIQSMSDRVLALSERGHTANDSRRAVGLLLENSFSVGGQMMIGLPGSTAEDEIMTAEEICRAGCASARIYPTLVFKGTKLDRMTALGEYTPLSPDDAAERGAAVLSVFERYGVSCLRIGLCESENLHDAGKYSAGPNHPALGEMIMSRLFYDKMAAACRAGDPNGKNMTVICPVGSVSKVVGHGKINREKLAKEFGIKTLKTIENGDYLGYNIKVLFND